MSEQWTFQQDMRKTHYLFKADTFEMLWKQLFFWQTNSQWSLHSKHWHSFLLASPLWPLPPLCHNSKSSLTDLSSSDPTITRTRCDGEFIFILTCLHNKKVSAYMNYEHYWINCSGRNNNDNSRDSWNTTKQFWLGSTIGSWNWLKHFILHVGILSTWC